MVKMNEIVYQITGIIPYSGGDRSVIATYLNKEKAEQRYEDERNGDTYIDVQMDEYEVDG